MAKKILESPHKIISLNVLATGQMILTTENRVYEHKDGKWTPMVFADDPVEPEPVPQAPSYDPVPEQNTKPYDPSYAGSAGQGYSLQPTPTPPLASPGTPNA